MERVSALATFLDIDEDEVEETSYNTYEAEGSEYLVVTEDEANKLAKTSIFDLFDDISVFGLSDYVTNWVINNALDSEWFEDAEKEIKESYAFEIKDESSSDDDMYVNRLHEEMVDEGLMEPCTAYEDEPDNEDEKLYSQWEESVEYERKEKESEAESLISEFVEKTISGDSIEYYKINFGEESLEKVAIDNHLVDTDAVAEMIIDVDGLGNTLASYDGEENNEDGYNIYRI